MTNGCEAVVPMRKPSLVTTVAYPDTIEFVILFEYVENKRLFTNLVGHQPIMRWMQCLNLQLFVAHLDYFGCNTAIFVYRYAICCCVSLMRSCNSLGNLLYIVAKFEMYYLVQRQFGIEHAPLVTILSFTDAYLTPIPLVVG